MADSQTYTTGSTTRGGGAALRSHHLRVELVRSHRARPRGCRAHLSPAMRREDTMPRLCQCFCTLQRRLRRLPWRRQKQARPRSPPRHGARHRAAPHARRCGLQLLLRRTLRDSQRAHTAQRRCSLRVGRAPMRAEQHRCASARRSRCGPDPATTRHWHHRCLPQRPRVPRRRRRAGHARRALPRTAPRAQRRPPSRRSARPHRSADRPRTVQ